MQQRSFEFATATGGSPLAVNLWCRQPPEDQSGRTLTWQIDDEQPSRACEAQASGAAPPPPDTAAAAHELGADPSDGPAQPCADGSGSQADLIGLDIWPASIALCRYLSSHPGLVAGQSVLELGAGMGLVGLLCAKLGARRVLLTDYEPQVLRHLGSNAALNGLQQQCSSLQLDWRDPARGLAPEQRGTWRLVVTADVLYAGAVVQPMVRTLQLLLHPEGVALIGHQVRRAVVLDRTTRLPRLEDSDEPLEAFKAACAAAGLALRVLGERPTCSNVDTDPMCLLAVGAAAAQERLQALPLPSSEA